MTAAPGTAQHSARPFNIVFLLGIGPMLSIIYLAASQDPILGTERDFGVFWTAATLIWQGQAAQIFDPDAFRTALQAVMGPGFPDLPFLYPPHSLFFIAPLGVFPKLVALILWLFATATWMMAMIWPHLHRRWILAIGLLLSPASIVNIACGQNGFLSAGLLAGGLLLTQARPAGAGLLFGLLSYKPQLGVFIPLLLLAGRHWRSFIVASLTVVAMILAGLIAWGPAPWHLYATETASHQFDIMRNFDFISLTSFMALRQLGAPLWIAGLIQGMFAVIGIGGAIWTMRQKVPVGMKAGIAMIATFLVSPYVLPYDMIIIAVAILLAAQTFVARWWECVIFGMVWLLPAFSFPASLPIGAVVIILLFLMLLGQAREIAQAHRP